MAQIISSGIDLHAPALQQQNQRQIQAWYLQVLWVLGARFITTGAL